METSTLREKLHALIDNSSDEKLMEVYSVFEDNYTDEFKAELGMKNLRIIKKMGNGEDLEILLAFPNPLPVLQYLYLH